MLCTRHSSSDNYRPPRRRSSSATASDSENTDQTRCSGSSSVPVVVMRDPSAPKMRDPTALESPALESTGWPLERREQCAVRMPDLGGLVKATGDDTRSVWTELSRNDAKGVTLEYGSQEPIAIHHAYDAEVGRWECSGNCSGGLAPEISRMPSEPSTASTPVRPRNIAL